jgi:hypothetical protein
VGLLEKFFGARNSLGIRDRAAVKRMMDRRVRELVLISLLAAFCGGLAFAHDRQLFAAAFAAAAVVAGFEARPR